MKKLFNYFIPFILGACIVSRFASWVSTVWLSLHAVIATAYIGMFTFNSMPFKECIGILRISSVSWHGSPLISLMLSHFIFQDGYALTNNSGQECLQKTFLTPFWENPFFFGVLSIALVVLWTIVMLWYDTKELCLYLFNFYTFHRDIEIY